MAPSQNNDKLNSNIKPTRSKDQTCGVNKTYRFQQMQNQAQLLPCTGYGTGQPCLEHQGFLKASRRFTQLVWTLTSLHHLSKANRSLKASSSKTLGMQPSPVNSQTSVTQQQSKLRPFLSQVLELQALRQQTFQHQRQPSSASLLLQLNQRFPRPQQQHKRQTKSQSRSKQQSLPQRSPLEAVKVRYPP